VKTVPYCPKCGNSVGEKDSFCAKCGQKISRKNALQKLEGSKKWGRWSKKADVAMWEALCIFLVVVGGAALGMAAFLSTLPQESLPFESWRLSPIIGFFVGMGVIFLVSAPLAYLHSKHLEEKLERETLRKEV